MDKKTNEVWDLLVIKNENDDDDSDSDNAVISTGTGTGTFKSANKTSSSDGVAETGNVSKPDVVVAGDDHENGDNDSVTVQSQADATPEFEQSSVFIGNVDYSTSAEELCQFFTECGNILRVTIPTTFSGHPKAYAFIEFENEEAVELALLKNGEILNGRELKVLPKRINQPGYSRVQQPVYYCCDSMRPGRFNNISKRFKPY